MQAVFRVACFVRVRAVVESGGVHHHQRADLVAWGMDIGIREIDLKPRNAGHGPGGRADFSGIVGQRGHVVTDNGAGIGEFRTDFLAAIT